MNDAVVQAYKAAGRDEYDVRKQNEVLDECLMMIPITNQEIAKAHAELSKMLEEEGVDAAIASDAIFLKAKETLETVPVTMAEAEAGGAAAPKE